MEYVDNTDWKVLLRSLNELDMKYYTFQLLKVRFSGPMRTVC
jgi:casein kinase II subunit alpha